MAPSRLWEVELKLFGERGTGAGLGILGVFLILCFVAAMGFVVWMDFAVTRLAYSVYYYLLVAPLTIAAASLIMKVLASALFGWSVSYSWLLAITGFAFLAMQVFGHANMMVYTFVWRFTRMFSLMASAVNLLIISAVVATVLRVASGRPWRQAFFLTAIGVFGLGFLVLFLTRAGGFHTPYFWPLIGF